MAIFQHEIAALQAYNDGKQSNIEQNKASNKQNKAKEREARPI